MIRWGWLAIAIVTAAVSHAPAAQADIRIATAGPMTGDYAWAGERYQRGAGLAVDDLNAKGGVLGQRVELIVGDDFCDPDQAAALARKLVSDGAVFVAGHRTLVLARLDPSLEDLRGGGHPHDRARLGQHQAHRRGGPERVPRLWPRRPARGEGGRLSRRPLGGPRDRDRRRRHDLGPGASPTAPGEGYASAVS